MASGYGPASWPVEPAQRVGAFLLGMGVNEALAVVQKMGSLDHAEFSFDEQCPFETDLTLRMPSLGVQLCFDSLQQDLRVIAVRLQQDEAGSAASEVAEASLVPPLSYCGSIFAGTTAPKGPPTLREVQKMFGPTWIGDFRPEGRSSYLLRYPGLTFEFPLPEDLVDELSRDQHPTELPNRPAPTASQLWVFASEAPSFLAPVSAVPDLPEAVIVRPAVGVELQGRVLRFGAMPQDVFSDFGPPEQVCVKDVDAVRIHSSRTLPVSRFAGPDYYFNYFHLGLDVLFDGQSHLVKKLILHANQPTHERFSRYTRCFFQLPLEPDQKPCEREEADIAAAAAGDALMDEPEADMAAVTTGDALLVEPEAPLAMPTPQLRAPPLAAEGRKKGKKSRAARAAVASPALQDAASPPLSAVSTPSEPSPILAKLRDHVGDCQGTGLLGASDLIDGMSSSCFDELPPPALPLDGLDATEADAEGGVRDSKDRTSVQGGAAGVCIDVKWRWEEIEEVLLRIAGFPKSKPLVVNQSSYTPFGSTYFYAVPGLVFEVMQNNYLASLTIFHVSPGELPAAFQQTSP